MTVLRLPFLDHDKWYVINVDRSDDGANPWQSRLVSLHGPNSTASVEWSLLGKYKFGWGFELGRNGGESDLGLNLYFGRLAKLWFRLRAPWTRWARIDKDSGDKDWFYARHTGLVIHPHEDCYLRGEFEALDGHWSKGDPWWRSWSITKTTILGRRTFDIQTGDSGEARIPLPEGVYVGTWQEEAYTNRYVRFPGTLIDRIFGPRSHKLVNVSVEGGIPVEGKGENSWDCGMDGIFGISGPTLADAIGNYTKAVLRDRDRHGGPHHLQRPMTVREAEAASG